MANSDRAIFLEALKEKPLTIADIVHMFDVSSNTARSWVRYPEVEHIPGSYPHMFRRKDTGTLPQVKPGGTKPPTEKPKGKYIELPNPPEEAIHQLFEQLMDDSAPEFHFNSEFRKVSSVKELDSVMNRLKSCIVVVQYYRDMMVRDEQ